MSRAVERKEHPLSMRLPKADIAIIDRAATLRGRSRTDFVRDAAVRAAEDVLAEVQACKSAHPDCYVRLIGYDRYRQSQAVSFVVHRP
jgi:uncharacterized protein (DUF1778 family)